MASVRGLVLEGKPTSNELQLKLKKLMQTPESREALAEALFECGVQSRQVKSAECFKGIADLIRFVLSVGDFEESVEPKLLYLILQTSCNLHTVQAHSRRKNYLYSLLRDHHLFTKLPVWRMTLHDQVKLKIELANERRRRRQEIEQ